MPSLTFGPESCRGSLLEPIPIGQFGQWVETSCLGRNGKAVTPPPPGGWPVAGWPGGKFSSKPVRRAGHWLHQWEADPAGTEAKADEMGVEVADLLCIGCRNRLIRNIAEGNWT